MVTKEEMISLVLEHVNGNSKPDVMAEALDRIGAISSGRAKPYTVVLMDVDYSDWSPWISVGETRDEAIAHAREQWDREQYDDGEAPTETFTAFKKLRLVKVYAGWIGMIVSEDEN